MAVQDPQLTSLEKTQGTLLGRLQASPTAQPGVTTASSSDMAEQQRLLQTKAQIDRINDEALKKRWYGDKTSGSTPEGAQPMGFLGKAVDVLSRPLRAVVGAVDYATGKSTASSLSGAITQNLTGTGQEKRTFGDVLKGYNMPLAAPLGFILDVAFDPVNWATMGTGALIPRVGAGLVRGTMKGGIAAGLKAAGKGAESRLLESTLTARNVGRALVPRAFKGAEDQVPGRVGTFMKGMEDRSLQSSSQYDELTGRDFLGSLSKRGQNILAGADSPYRVKFGDLVREAASQTPWVKNWFKYFDYNNAEWTRIAKIKDSLLKTVGAQNAQDVNNGIKAYVRADTNGTTFEEEFAKIMSEPGQKSEFLKKLDNVSPAPAESVAEGIVDSPAVIGGSKDVHGKIEEFLKDGSAAVDIIKTPERFVTSDTFENGLRMAQESVNQGNRITINDLKDIIGRGELGDTGIAWFDKLRSRTDRFKFSAKFGKTGQKVGEITADAIDKYIGLMSIFKRGKVGASLTAWTNAVIGNPTMAWMAGVNILDPLYLSRVKEAASIAYGGKNSSRFLNDLMQAPGMVRALDNNPTLFKKTTGLSSDFLRGKHAIEDIYRTAKENGIIGDDMSVEELGKAVGAATEELTAALKAVRAESSKFSVKGNAPRIVQQKPSVELQKQIRQGKHVTEADVSSTGVVANEFLDSGFAQQFVKGIKDRAETSNNPVWRILNTTFNKASEAYEGIDQSYKLGMTMYATMDGFTEKELRVLARSIDVTKDDFVKTALNGVVRYKMDEAKAMELANEIYLNYNAMPAAVKVLRNLPFLGSPFASFAYGMGLKTIKTAAYNPSAFNKVTFALNEMSQGQSPLERGILSGDTYSYLKAPGMIKFSGGSESNPFFQTYGMYLNMAGMIPYYSLNFFTPTERKYNDINSNRVVGMIDRSPFLKDPVMSVIFDNFIQPLIIKDASERLQSSFGQPLYPIDATLGEKAAYTARSFVEPFVPTGLGVAAAIPSVLTGGRFGPPNVVKNFAPSYNYRKIINALEGKNPLGVSGKEDPAMRTVRSGAGSLGFPLTPLPMSYLPKEVEQKISQGK